MNKKDLINSLSQFILELKENEKAERTINKYVSNIQVFIDYIQHENDLTKFDIINFKQHINDSGYLPSTANLYLVSVNKYLRWLGADNLRVKKLNLQLKSSIDDVITLNEYDRLIRFAKRYQYNEVYLVMKIIKMTGIRIGELKFFTVEALSLKGKEKFKIHVKNKGKERTVNVPQELWRELKQYVKTENIIAGPIIKSNELKIWRSMKRIAGYAKIRKDKVHAHSFRHLFAKEYHSEHNDPMELADVLGHSSLETTRIYTRSTDEEKRHKLEKLTRRKA